MYHDLHLPPASRFAFGAMYHDFHLPPASRFAFGAIITA